MAQIKIRAFPLVFMALLVISMKMVEAAPAESEISKEQVTIPAVVEVPISFQVPDSVPAPAPEVLVSSPVETQVQVETPDAIQPQTGSIKRFFKIMGINPGQLAQSFLGSKITQSIVSSAAGKIGETDVGCKVGGLVFGSGIGGVVGSQAGEGGGKVVNTFGTKLVTKCENKANGQSKNPSASVSAPAQNEQESVAEEMSRIFYKLL